ncbi:hypothetical protein [Porphyromonas asaccharolytica]|uniref:hypothetical protein n=1 Tax=Porphyromonas asaccharolytica TaxID=28123 RepID=UPI00248F330E|nr:hypothetical protein [Porphyromonas asaccharolytica]
MNDFNNKEGRLELDDYFFKVRDLRILGVLRDGETEQPIIAYIPNKRMEEAEVAITTAYNEGSYDEVYRLFQELYTAIPTTTARWQALKAKGEQHHRTAPTSRAVPDFQQDHRKKLRFLLAFELRKQRVTRLGLIQHYSCRLDTTDALTIGVRAVRPYMSLSVNIRSEES